MGTPLGLRPPGGLIRAPSNRLLRVAWLVITLPSTYFQIASAIVVAIERPPQRISLQEKIACPQLDVAMQLNLEVLNTVAVQVALDNGSISFVFIVPSERAGLVVE
jgi:hypothetical protein